MRVHLPLCFLSSPYYICINKIEYLLKSLRFLLLFFFSHKAALTLPFTAICLSYFLTFAVLMTPHYPLLIYSNALSQAPLERFLLCLFLPLFFYNYTAQWKQIICFLFAAAFYSFLYLLFTQGISFSCLGSPALWFSQPFSTGHVF